MRHLRCIILAKISRAGVEPFYNDAESVRLTVADQKRNEHTGSPPPPSPLFEIAQSGCVFTPRGNARETEKENVRRRKEEKERGRGGGEGEREREAAGWRKVLR